MSELTLFLIRLAYLAILWIFVLSAISVIRSDMFGARAPAAGRDAPRSGKSKKKSSKPPPKRRGSPTHVLVVDGANSGERADLAIGRDLAHEVIGTIGNIHTAGAIDRNAIRRIETSG